MEILAELKSVTTKPVVIANHRGVIIFVNKMFEQTFQWTSDEIVGQPITAIIPFNFHDAHHLGFSRFQSTELSTVLNHPLKLKTVKKNGDVFPAEHIIFAEKENGSWVFGATVEPLEEEK